MNSFETIIYEKTPGIAYITLNRPQQLNAVNLQMRDDLWEAITAFRDDPEVRVAIFRGAGERAFSAGADITEFGTAPSQAIARQVRWERDLWGLLLGIDKPLIAALHGYALGAGIELAMCCDIRIAAENTRIGLPEVALGMIPTAGGSQTLTRLVRRGAALEIILTGDRITAQEAYRIGLVHRVVALDQLVPTAEEMARKIMAQGDPALHYAKRAIKQGLDMSIEEGLRLEKLLAAYLWTTEACAEGIKARRKRSK
ncbi:MAG: enoyl-CoA hydratase/isomerase family protein [Chloroflexi bacterium]|nr:enoyl-CoA hydratase/isomerase family protein [Chloroflexota bacterium]